MAKLLKGFIVISPLLGAKKHYLNPTDPNSNPDVILILNTLQIHPVYNPVHISATW